MEQSLCVLFGISLGIILGMMIMYVILFVLEENRKIIRQTEEALERNKRLKQILDEHTGISLWVEEEKE